MVNEKIEEAIRLLFRCEGWSTGFEVSECETEWCNTPPHGTVRKCLSLRAMVITCNQYVQINTGILEKVIA